MLGFVVSLLSDIQVGVAKTFMQKSLTLRIASLLLFLALSSIGFGEGTKELNINCTGNMITNLYLCNNFSTHCNNSGYRNQFAVYDATQSTSDAEKLFFVTQANEVVYMGFQEGNTPNNTHIVFRIKNSAGTVVFAEQNMPTASPGYIANLTQACNGPNQTLPPPATSGYDALVFTPPAAGTYYIEFSLKSNSSGAYVSNQFDVDYFDLTVYNTSTSTVKLGRLYCKSWQFSALNSPYFTGQNYILSDDGIVTSIQFSQMQGGAWIQFANQTGCGITNWVNDRKSLFNQQALYPQYKVFLNSPDPNVFTIATTLGQIIPPDPYGVRHCDGTVDFIVNVDKAGNVQIDLTFTPSTYTTRTLGQAVVAGSNTIPWDGKDGSGVNVPNNVLISFTVKYINGLTNLPLYDVEGNTQGFLVSLVAPPGNAPNVFWDDANIWNGTGSSQAGRGTNSLDVQSNVATGGCATPATFPGCHKWPGTGNGWGNLNTINSWWYTVSTSTTYPTIAQWRSPQNLTWAVGPQSVCAGTNGVSISVTPDPNTETYHWGYTGTGATFVPSATTSSASVTVNFAANATSGNLTVYGTNTNCNTSPSTTITLPVTINPIPVPTLTGSTSVCNQSSSNIYSTQAGMSNYIWNITGGNITAGGSLFDNTATVTWNTPGNQTISVNYTQSGCTGAAPAVRNVTVNALPVPTFNIGPVSACVNVPGNIYMTQPGMSNYIWSISGGTITSGGTSTDNTATVTWTSVGAGSISVNFTDPATNCTALTPTLLPVTVNALPTPTFTGGDQSVCVGTIGHTYTTQAGQSHYTWTVNGGNITAGGTLSDDYVTVTWPSMGAYSVSVNYQNASSCQAENPTVFNVTVNPLPVPVITGQAAACLNTSGTYTTAAGMTGYTWTVSGGTITSGVGTNTVDVLWTVLGTGTISVNYTDGNGCTALSPTDYSVTVNNLPVPTISGNTSVCVGLQQTYTTEAGMSTYSWIVSPSGTITGGTGTNSITVLWNSAGPATVDVNYTIGTGCTAPTPTQVSVTVHPLPAPTVSGLQTVCQNTTQTYTTEAGMTGYTWTVSSEGTITSGAGTNSINVLWSSAGSGNLTVNYTDLNSCTAVSPVSYPVTVNAAPVPVITSPAEACIGSSSTISTTSGMSNYIWTVTGGTVSSGSGTNSITVAWNTLGNQTITLVYTDLNGCLPLNPSQQNLLVNPLPAPVISGPQQVCYSQAGSVYSTPAVTGHDYTWTVTGAVSFTGNHTNSITVDWGPSGTGTVQMTETDQNHPTNCSTTTPVYNVIINPAPTPVISGLSTPCGQTTQTYTIGTPQANHAYTWTVTGGTPASGSSSSITVTWGNTNPVSIGMVESITYAPGVICSAAAPSFPVSLVLIPDAAGTISGPSTTCQALTQNFSIGPINNADSYTWWYLPATGVTITNNGTNAILNFDLTSGSGSLYVQGNKTGCASGPASPAHPVTVYGQPYVSLTLCNDLKTTSTSRAFTLKGGVPAGGVYFVDGVANPTGIFNPSVLSTTSHQITYRFTDFHSCENTSSPVTITVVTGSNLASCPNTFTDVRDNRTYRSFTMGTRCWMLENLKYGTELSPFTTHQKDNCIPEKYCLSTDAACTSFGGFYQWDELIQYSSPAAGQSVQGLCPPEWHIPTEAEWQLLIDMQANGGNGIAGSELKDPIPSFGFHALLSGIYYLNDTWALTTGSLTGTMFWTSAGAGATRAVARGLNTYNPSVSRYVSSRENAFPVRCVKD